MPRLPRVVVPHVPHHVTERGVRRMEVFFADGQGRSPGMNGRADPWAMRDSSRGWNVSSVAPSFPAVQAEDAGKVRNEYGVPR